MNIKGLLWHEGSNGLGVGPIWLRRLLPYRKLFDKAARIHDQCYDTKGNSRKLYDLLFLYNCLNVCTNPLQKFIAYIYYILVRLFGWLFYRYQK